MPNYFLAKLLPSSVTNGNGDHLSVQLDSALRAAAGGYLLGEPERRAPPLPLQGPPHKHLPLHRPVLLHLANLHHHSGMKQIQIILASKIQPRTNFAGRVVPEPQNADEGLGPNQRLPPHTSPLDAVRPSARHSGLFGLAYGALEKAS